MLPATTHVMNKVRKWTKVPCRLVEASVKNKINNVKCKLVWNMKRKGDKKGLVSDYYKCLADYVICFNSLMRALQTMPHYYISFPKLLNYDRIKPSKRSWLCGVIVIRCQLNKTETSRSIIQSFYNIYLLVVYQCSHTHTDTMTKTQKNI